jgi:hypothetical protein
MSVTLLLAIPFAVIIAGGSVAVFVNDLLEGCLRRSGECADSGGGRTGPAAEDGRWRGARAGGGLPGRTPLPAARPRTFGRVRERRAGGARPPQRSPGGVR